MNKCNQIIKDNVIKIENNNYEKIKKELDQELKNIKKENEKIKLLENDIFKK